jgi:succinate dehydrogenase hydrophobic anchor subunit
MIHLVVNHMVAPGGLLTYADVITYYRNPIVPLMESAFLLFVVPHALIGARGIVLDLDPRPGLVRVLDIALVTGGMAVIGYGLWLVQVIVARAAM